MDISITNWRYREENKHKHKTPIRYRAFDGGFMIYSSEVEYVEVHGGKGSYQWYQNEGYDLRLGSFFFRIRKDAIIMEWVGFHDSKCREVYEDDTCKLGEYVGYIYKDKKTASFVLKCVVDGDDVLIPLTPTCEDTNLWCIKDLEITGNLHENIPQQLNIPVELNKCECCEKLFHGQLMFGTTCSEKCKMEICKHINTERVDKDESRFDIVCLDCGLINGMNSVVLGKFDKSDAL